MSRPAPPDGYRWTGRGPEIVLVDPDTCPAGHPFTFGQRGYTHCSERSHHGHTYWLCACGQETYRAPGAFVDQLDCVTGH